MGDTYQIVTGIMAGFAVIYILMEIILNVNGIDDDTSNIILLEASKKKLFFIPFALGAILGHLFLGTTNTAFEMSDSLYPVAILFGSATISVGIAYWKDFKKPLWFLSLLLVLGLVYGHLFWSMNYAS
ncbi:hypothetical protein M3P19_03610 [Muricauda sp. 2012CJ35-5]|uniref:Uncharacterized protein n=1 Tax=Flagellimonas spongiicola TaxID=2942208 RepID=A0ABT0PNX2_9FLAO|nr:hypothetical protein [Allomuricauda spongiicola]MCL6273079.1 hypothetical protein [Allomuricauda spongiicola]